MTAPSEAPSSFISRDRTAATTLEPRARATRRSRILPFPVLVDGTVDLPIGAVVVALDFEDDGGLGCRRRPAIAWAEVATERAPRVERGPR